MLKEKLKRIWFVMVLSVFFMSGCAVATTTPSTASQTTAEPTVISVQTDNSGTTENITPSPNPSETLNVTADDQDGDENTNNDAEDDDKPCLGKKVNSQPFKAEPDGFQNPEFLPAQESQPEKHVAQCYR